jgi:hypothetical protein
LVARLLRHLSTGPKNPSGDDATVRFERPRYPPKLVLALAIPAARAAPCAHPTSTQTVRPAANAASTASRIMSTGGGPWRCARGRIRCSGPGHQSPTGEYAAVEYGELPVKYSVFVVTLCCNIFQISTNGRQPAGICTVHPRNHIRDGLARIQVTFADTSDESPLRDLQVARPLRRQALASVGRKRNRLRPAPGIR